MPGEESGRVDELCSNSMFRTAIRKIAGVVRCLALKPKSQGINITWIKMRHQGISTSGVEHLRLRYSCMTWEERRASKVQN